MKTADMLAVLFFHLYKLSFLFWGEEGGDLRVGLADPIQHLLRRFASEDFQIRARLVDQRFDLHHLFIC